VPFVILQSSATSNPLGLKEIWEITFVKSAATLVLVAIVLVVMRMFLGKTASSPTKNFRTHATMLGFTIAGALTVGLVVSHEFGLSDTMMQVIGAVIVGTLGLSSTTILGNALAGVQMRVVAAFKAGDFLRVGDHFGRVTERGLFHTEIQTEDRDLTTLPNLFLVSHPYRVVRASGTIISATVSLGYDTSRTRVEKALLEAARNAGLEEPFVQIVDLGDFTVNYRIAGLFTDVKQILTCRSNLRKLVMDAVHGAGIEIVSPTFMNTRALDPDRPVVPVRSRPEKKDDAPAPEAIMFDKAEEAESLEKVRRRLDAIDAELADAKEGLKTADESTKPVIGAEVEALQREREQLTRDRESLEQIIQKNNEE
jgi:small conductance mechanosensitive channel